MSRFLFFFSFFCCLTIFFFFAQPDLELFPEYKHWHCFSNCLCATLIICAMEMYFLLIDMWRFLKLSVALVNPAGVIFIHGTYSGINYTYILQEYTQWWDVTKYIYSLRYLYLLEYFHLLLLYFPLHYIYLITLVTSHCADDMLYLLSGRRTVILVQILLHVTFSCIMLQYTDLE